MKGSIFVIIRILLIAFIALWVSRLAAQTVGDTYKKAKSAGHGTITYVYVKTPGFAAKDSNGEVSGICVDIMKEFVKYVAQKKNLKLTLKFKNHGDANNFKLFMTTVKNSRGGVFGLGNITITEARKKSYNFSPSFMTNVTIMLTHSSVPSLKKLSQIATTFKGMKAITVKGTTNEQNILEIKKKYMPSLQIVQVKSSEAALNKVITDKTSFTNLDFTYYLAVLKQRKPIKRHQDADKATEKFGIIMPKSNDWSPLLAEFFDSGFIGGVEYRKSISRHLGANALKLLDYYNKQ